MEIKLEDVSSKNLKNLSITFEEKKIISLIGSNQSGKTELINLISSLEKIESGVIKIGRKKLDSNCNSKKKQEVINQVYYLKEDYKNMLFNINIGEDFKYYLGDYDTEKIKELLKSFSLDNSILNKCYIDLSSSEIRKILLIIGLTISSKVIIFENPTLKLDIKSIQTLIKYLKKLKREEKIIIVSSYNTNFLLEVSDKIIAMNDGKIIKQGNKFDVLSDGKILDKINLNTPNILDFIVKAKTKKNIKINNIDNINDLIKEIFRRAK